MSHSTNQSSDPRVIFFSQQSTPKFTILFNPVHPNPCFSCRFLCTYFDADKENSFKISKLKWMVITSFILVTLVFDSGGII